MKKWCKIIYLDGFDILVQRLVNRTHGEHVSITVRFSEGQYVAINSFGEGDEAEKMSEQFFKNYKKPDAEKFVEAFNMKLNGNTEKKDDK